MKAAFLAAVIAALALFVANASQIEEKSPEFAKKSVELTSSLNTRAEKADAIFNFVRDQIAQIKTQYG